MIYNLLLFGLVVVVGFSAVKCRTIYMEMSLPTDDELSFMKRYGYLPEEQADLESAYTPLSIADAVKRMQAFAGLPPTGTLNADTRKLFTKKRCGVKDIDSSRARSRRFVVQKGWNKTSITYRVLNGSRSLPLERIERLMSAALAVWAPHGQLHFRPTSTDHRPADIQVSFVSGNHGDGFPFDGPGQVVAHAFPPPHGAMHFDDDETWSDSTNTSTSTSEEDDDVTDFFAVAVHEVGHALGLSHSNVKHSVMYPYYQVPIEHLHMDDILGMHELYSKQQRNDSQEVIGTTKRPQSDSQEVIGTTKQPRSDSQEVIGTTERQLSHSQEVTATTKHPRSDSQEVTATTKRQRSESREVTGTTKQQRSQSQEVTATTKRPRSDSQEVTATTKRQRSESREVTGITKRPISDSKEVTATTKRQQSESREVTGTTKQQPSHSQEVTATTKRQRSGSQEVTATPGTESSVASSPVPHFTNANRKEDMPDLSYTNDTITVINEDIYVDEWVSVLTDRKQMSAGYPRPYHSEFVGMPRPVTFVRTIYQRRVTRILIIAG